MNWRLLAALFALTAAAFVARTLYNAETIPLLADTDDAMRLVVVRDLLAGQGWYDLVQHRLNTPYGAELHWSRLADLPFAAAIVILRPLLGSMAETAAAYIVPLGLLFILLYLSGRATLRLVGADGLLPALVLPALSLSVMGEFIPGRIDHHALQILLLMTMLWCALEAVTKPGFAIGAGLAAATSVALGIEGIPSVAAMVIAFGTLWVIRPERADALRGFGFSFAGASLGHLAVALPPERWLVPACDAISIVYVAASLGTGAAFLVLSTLRSGSPWWRLTAGIAIGGVLVAGLLLAFPECASGPYSALDPWLLSNWIDKITEAAPWLTSLLHDPAYPLAVGVPAVLAMGVAVHRLAQTDRDDRLRWLVYAIFLALAVITMLVQIRASRMATSLAVPAGAWLIVAARQLYLRRRSVISTGALVLSWIASAGVAIGVATTLTVNTLADGVATTDATAAVADRRDCLMPEAFTTLADMAPQRVMTPIDLGSHMLLFTPHQVVAAPYHRNEAGVRDAFRFFNAPMDEARAIIESRGITLVVTCPAMPEMGGLADAAVDSFVRLAPADALPDWLDEQGSPDGPLRIYAVRPTP